VKGNCIQRSPNISQECYGRAANHGRDLGYANQSKKIETGEEVEIRTGETCRALKSFEVQANKELRAELYDRQNACVRNPDFYRLH
jgi:hypothetical protein